MEYIGNDFSWGLFNPHAKILTKRYIRNDSGTDYWENNTLIVNLSNQLVFRDGLDSLYNESSFEFVSDTKLDINENDAFEFTFNGERVTHLIQTFTETPYTFNPVTWKYTITTIDYTYFLAQFYTTLAFPRSNEWSWNSERNNWENLFDVVERVRNQQYIQPLDNRRTFSLYDGYTEKLERKLTEYRLPPEFYFKDKTTLSALDEIFSLIGGRPFITFDDSNRMLLDILDFDSTEVQVEIPIKGLTAYSNTGNNAEYATHMRSEVDNVSGSINTMQEIVHFTSGPGFWNAANAVIETNKPIKRVVKALLYRYRFGAGGVLAVDETPEYIGNITNYIFPDGVYRALEYDPSNSNSNPDRNNSVYYTIGSNTISGWGDTRTNASSIDQDLVYKEMFESVNLVHKPGDNNLAQYYLALTYETLTDNEYVEVTRGDRTRQNKLSTISVNQNSRQVCYETLTNKMVSELNMRGQETINKTVTYTNKQDIIVHPLLARDTESGYLISSRSFTVDGLEVSITYTLVKSYNFIPEYINIDVSERAYGIDLDNAIIRPIMYTEYLEIGDKPSPINETVLPSITQAGMQEFTRILKPVSYEQVDLISPAPNAYYDYDDNGATLLIPTVPMSGINTNTFTIQGRDGIYIGDRISSVNGNSNNSDSAEIISVPYTNNGYVDRVGLNFCNENIFDSTNLNFTSDVVAQLPALPQDQTSQDKFRKYANENSLISIANQEVDIKVVGEGDLKAAYIDTDKSQVKYGAGAWSSKVDYDYSYTKSFDLTHDDGISFNGGIIDSNNNILDSNIYLEIYPKVMFKSSFVIGASFIGVETYGNPNSFSCNIDIEINIFDKDSDELVTTYDTSTTLQTSMFDLGENHIDQVNSLLGYNANTELWRIFREQISVPVKYRNFNYFKSTTNPITSNFRVEYKQRTYGHVSNIGNNTKTAMLVNEQGFTSFRFVTNIVTSGEGVDTSQRFLSIEKNPSEVMQLGYQQHIVKQTPNYGVGAGLSLYNTLFNQFNSTGRTYCNIYISEDLYAESNTHSPIGSEVNSLTGDIQNPLDFGQQYDHPILSSASDGDYTKYYPTKRQRLFPEPENIGVGAGTGQIDPNKTYRSMSLVLSYDINDDSSNGQESILLVYKNFPQGFTYQDLVDDPSISDIYYSFRSECSDINLNWNPHAQTVNTIVR